MIRIQLSETLLIVFIKLQLAPSTTGQICLVAQCE